MSFKFKVIIFVSAVLFFASAGMLSASVMRWNESAEPTLTIAGRVSLDNYPLGCQGYEDFDAAGITVTLQRISWGPCGGGNEGYCGNYTAISNVSTDSRGTFLFKDVPEGEYVITFPSWLVVTGETWVNTSSMLTSNMIILKPIMIRQFQY